MSITQSLSNAVSGLTASARSAEVVSNNVANVATEGYARREIELGARALMSKGAGVRVEGVARVVDGMLLRDRRLADAAAGGAEVRAGFYGDLERLVGTPTDAASLTGRIASFEASLMEAASRPSSQPRLEQVLNAATAVAQQFNDVADGIQQQRMDAEMKIERQVGDLNRALTQVHELNKRIVGARQLDRDAGALLDQRQKVVDAIAQIVPVRTTEHEFGRLEIRTVNGAGLVDRTAATVGFSRQSMIVADMTLQSGALSGLTLNGRAIDVSGDAGPLSGGSLSALFELRDDWAPEAQAEVDALARDMIERFQSTQADPTRPAGMPGLFTDAGALFAPADEPGLAARVAVNDARVRPEAGGELFRIRDGIGAAVEGDVGNATQLNRLTDALRERRVPGSGPFSAARDASGLSADFLSGIGGNRRSSEDTRSFMSAQADHLKTRQLADGVDTDQEMQKLLLIEQAYAANARVITAADAMIRRLLEI